MSITIKRCLSDEDILKTLPVIRQLRDFADDVYLNTIESLVGEGYHLVGCFDSDGECLAVLGYNLCSRLCTGKTMYIADLVVDEAHRGSGHGGALMAWAKSEAKTVECQTIALDSGVQRSAAHKFYFNQGFSITSFNFKLMDW